MATDKAALLNFLKTTLQATTWTGGAVKTFGDGLVHITNVAAETIAAKKSGTREALIRCGGWEADRDHPTQDEFGITITIMTWMEGDAHYGERILMGFNQVANSPVGRGLLEIETELRTNSGWLQRDDGVPIDFIGSDGPPPVMIESGLAWGYMNLNFTSRVSID